MTIRQFVLVACLGLALPSQARDLTTTGGHTYRDVNVLSVDPNGIKISHRDGIAVLLVSDLPVEAQAEITADPMSDEVLPTPELARVNEIITLDGTLYRDVTVTRIERTGIRVTHRDGLGFLDFGVLPKSIRDRYGYSELKYAAGKMAKLRQQKAYTEALRQSQAEEERRALEEAERQAAAKAFQDALIRATTPLPSQRSITDRDYASRDYSTRSYDAPKYSSSIRSGGPVQVRGYFRKDGTYVRPHTRRR